MGGNIHEIDPGQLSALQQALRVRNDKDPFKNPISREIKRLKLQKFLYSTSYFLTMIAGGIGIYGGIGAALWSHDLHFLLGLVPGIPLELSSVFLYRMKNRVSLPLQQHKLRTRFV